MAQCRGPVSSLCHAAELNAIVASDTSGGVHVLSSPSAEKQREVNCEAAVLSVAYAPGLRAFISAEGSMAKEISTVTVWDLLSGEKRTQMTYGNFLCCVVYAPEIHAIISGDGNFMKDKEAGQVVVWNIDTLEQHRKLRCTKAVTNILYMGDARAVVSADRSNAVVRWDLESGAKRWEVQAEELPWSLAYAPELRAVVVAESNFKTQVGRLAVLDAETGARRCHFHVGCAVSCIAWLPELRAVACGQRDGQLTLWDPEARRQRWAAPLAGPVTSMAYCGISRRLATGCKDGSVRIWVLDDFR